MLNLTIRIGCQSLVVAALLSSTELSVAQNAHDDAHDAKQVFLQGVSLFSSGDYAGAEAAFETSFSLAPKPFVLFNIAMSQKAQRRYIDAIASFKWYLEVESTDESEEKRQRALAAVVEMEALLKNASIEHGGTATVDAKHTHVSGSDDSSPLHAKGTEPGDERERKSATKDTTGWFEAHVVIRQTAPILRFSTNGKTNVGLLLGAAVTGVIGLGAVALGSYFLYQREIVDIEDAEAAILANDYQQYGAVLSKARAHVASSAVAYAFAGALLVSSIVLIIKHRGNSIKYNESIFAPYSRADGIVLTF